MTSYTTKTLASRLINAALGPQPLIPIHKPFLQLTGDYAAAAFLAQALYLSERLASEDGWFDYTTEAWAADLQISRERLRRCQRICKPFVTIERRGIPCRNFFRVEQEALSAALETLKAGSNPGSGPLPGGQPPKTNPAPAARKPGVRNPQLQGSQPQRTGTSSDRKTSPPVNREFQPTAPLLYSEEKQQEISPAVVVLSNRDDVCRSQAAHGDHRPQSLPARPPRDDVRPPRPDHRTSEAAYQQLLDIFNSHRGRLPEAQGLTASRKRNLRVLLSDCGHDLQQAAQLLERATREVAQDEFWMQKRLGFDNLVPNKVAGKAEAWLSRQPVTRPGDDVLPPAFSVGDRVSYQREGYTVEALTSTYAELYDEQNGSVRVLRSSPVWNTLRRLEGSHATP